MKKTFLTLSILAALPVHAGETQIGRYTSVSNTASYAQQNLLAAEIKVQFPDQVTSLKQAFEQLLDNSGYRLAQDGLDPDIAVLYEQSLPGVHRWMGPVTLREALQTLAGESWHLQENPVDRTVTFLLDESQRHLVSKRLPLATGEELKIDSSNKSWACDKGYRVVADSAIYFAPNSFSLNYRDKQQLDLLAKEASQKDLGIVINSYADPDGPIAMHMVLSKARGNAISDYFVSRGLKPQIVANNALGATYPKPDTPASLQRVSEITLVKNQCLLPEFNIPIWEVKAGSTLKDTVFAWLQKSADWKSLVYEVKNPQGEEVKIFFHSDSILRGNLVDVLGSHVYQLLDRSEVKSLKAYFYEGDQTVVIKGVIDTSGEAK